MQKCHKFRRQVSPVFHFVCSEAIVASTQLLRSLQMALEHAYEAFKIAKEAPPSVQEASMKPPKMPRGSRNAPIIAAAGEIHQVRMPKQ